MRVVEISVWILFGALIAFSCTPEDEDRCGDDFVWADSGCYSTDTGSSDSDTDTDADSDADSGTGYDPAQWIGASCSCEGDTCAPMGPPVPNAEGIVGCEDVSTNWTGADKACMRSYGGELGPKTYYANGYCSLVATSCEGEELICGSAVIGEYDAMTDCPAGAALIQSTSEITVASMTATLQAKNCAVLCEADTDCRNDETDPIFAGEATQYQCIEKDGVKFCQDPRNLPEGYTVQAF